MRTDNLLRFVPPFRPKPTLELETKYSFRCTVPTMKNDSNSFMMRGGVYVCDNGFVTLEAHDIAEVAAKITVATKIERID